MNEDKQTVTTDNTEEEKELLGKIKQVVEKTIDDKMASQQKSTILPAGDAKSKAYDLMNKTQRNRYSSLDDNAKKEYENAVIIAHYFKALYNRDRTMIKDLSEGTDSEGGYLVPAPLSNKIYEVITAQGHARREMTTIPMTSMTLDLSTLATAPTIYYVNEGAQITQSDIAFGRKTLTAQKMAGITAMSNELLEDANIDIINYNVQKFAEAFVEEEDAAFFNTSASTGITGILEDTGTTSVAMATGDDAFTDLSYDYLVSAVYALGAKQRVNAKWCFSSYITSLVMKLKDSNNMPIWSRAVEGQPATLLGYPVIENDEMPGSSDSGASTKFISFGNYKKYIIGDRQKLTASVLKEGTVGSTNLAEKDSSGLRVVQRVSGIAPTPTEFAVLATGATS